MPELKVAEMVARAWLILVVVLISSATQIKAENLSKKVTVYIPTYGVAAIIWWAWLFMAYDYLGFDTKADTPTLPTVLAIVIYLSWSVVAAVITNRVCNREFRAPFTS